MRDIKFRKWDKDNKVMSEPFYLGSVLAELSLGEEVMQYTGLKDKNWREIYEGDIDPEKRGYEVEAVNDSDYEEYEFYK